MKKWILITLGALVALVAIAYLVGTRLPREHVATVRAHYRQPPDSIYRVLTQVAEYPSWRHDVKAVELLPERNGHLVWRERAGSAALDFEFTVAVRPTRLVSTLVSTDAGFTGRWICQILPDASGTMLTITEEGAVDNPLFRFLLRFVFGVDGSLEKFLGALGSRFGERETMRTVRIS